MEYDDIGTGIPLLLIHGFPHDRSLWRPQFDGLKDQARMIAPDLSDFGASGTALETMNMDDYATDLKALLDKLEIKQAVICGLSMGGYIALAFLSRYPDAVKGLILCNTKAGADDEKAREGRLETAAKVHDKGMAALAEGMLPKMLTAATIATQPNVSAAVKDMMARQPPDGVVAALQGMAARPDRTRMLARITVPTLIITGSADTAIPPSESKVLADAILGSKLLVIPDVGHLSNVEAPEAFNAAVRDFVDGLG